MLVVLAPMVELPADSKAAVELNMLALVQFVGVLDREDRAGSAADTVVAGMDLLFLEQEAVADTVRTAVAVVVVVVDNRYYQQMSQAAYMEPQADHMMPNATPPSEFPTKACKSHELSPSCQPTERRSWKNDAIPNR